MKVCVVRILDIKQEKMNKLCSSIDSDEKYKIYKFVNLKDKIRTLIGDILVRTLIIEELGIRNNIEFDKNPYGKSYLKGFPEINFNISHSGDFVLCAMDVKPIRIDIEKVELMEYRDIAESFFTTSECEYILKNESCIQLSKFYEIWTLKESYIKCRGAGLSIPLKSFSINIDRYENVELICDNANHGYIFKRFEHGARL